MKIVLSTGVVAALALSAQAQLTFISGTQTNTGYVRNVDGIFDVSDSYSEAAPSAINSWNPAPRNITAQAAPGTGMGHLETTWTSTLENGRLAWRATTPVARVASNGMAAESAYRYEKTFDIVFHVDTPTQVSVSAMITRYTGGWNTGTPFSLSFGPVGGPAILSFAATPGVPFGYTGNFPVTLLDLVPGDYRVAAMNHAAWAGGRHGEVTASDDMVFDLTVVPAPGGLLAIAGGLLAASRRRRS